MLKFDTIEVDEAALPPAVVHKMLQASFSHILGNEVASSVLGQERKAVIEASKATGDTPLTLADLKGTDNPHLAAFRAANAKLIDEWESAAREAKVAAMLDGTIAVRSTRAPTRDPVEAAARAIARLEIAGILKRDGLKFPGKDETMLLGTQEFTGDELIDRRIANPAHADRIRKEAERKVREDRRMRDQAAKAAAGSEVGIGDL